MKPAIFKVAASMISSTRQRLGPRTWIYFCVAAISLLAEYYFESPFKIKLKVITVTPGLAYLLFLVFLPGAQLEQRRQGDNVSDGSVKQPQLATAKISRPELPKYVCGKCDTTLLEKNILRCARCKAVNYCSSECQKRAWKEHKKVCKRVLRGWVRGNSDIPGGDGFSNDFSSSSPFEKVLSAVGPLIADFMSVSTLIKFDSAVSSRAVRIIWLQKCIRHSRHYYHKSLESAKWVARKGGVVLSVVMRTQGNPLELVTDVDLKELGLLCPQLQSLSFGFPRGLLGWGVPENIDKHCRDGATLVSDVGLRALAEYCPELRHLDLYGCKWVSNEGINAIAKGCPKLLSINLGWLRLTGEQNNPHHLITHAALATLAASCPELKSVCLNTCCSIDMAVFNELKQKYKHINFGR